ncbi:MAG: glycosyltransferase family 2 protein [Rhodospirillales bacterium]|nr:glycosyltransferase family 2 protein [Rhodospirillales bacterium]
MTARRKPRVRRGAKGMPVLSVIVPIFNEALNIENFFERLMPVLDGLKVACEVICVDDGSIDDTRQRIVEFNAQDPRIKLLGLSRNFGKDIALTAGLHAATGQAAIPIDADLQHPPELIPNLIAKWREGYDVVYAARSSRATDDPMRRAASWLFYWIFDRFSEVSIPHDAGDFRLLDRRVIDVLNRMPERSRFMKGIFAWVGFRQIGIPFEVEARAYGRSGWSLRRLMRFAIDGLTAFSNVPLIAWGYAGALVAFVSLGAGTYFLILRCGDGETGKHPAVRR